MKNYLHFAATAFAIACLPLAATAEPRSFGNKVTIGVVGNVKLTNAQRRAFKSYSSNKSYFGAFYIVPGTDDVFWTRRFHGLNTAKASAKRGCEVAHKSKSCQLYAVVFPVGIDPNGGDVSGMSQAASKDFQRRYPKQQKKGKYGAFALDGASGWGYAYGWDNAKEANAAALEFCMANSTRELAKLPIDGRKWVRSRGLHKCKLVSTHKPAE